jgi:hypothetical protein
MSENVEHRAVPEDEMDGLALAWGEAEPAEELDEFTEAQRRHAAAAEDA